MTQNSPLPATPYRVLARQYRPQKLSELVGQDTLVKTLAQGIERNRLPHAFLLHGIRGVGKTTTARILAKALNCLGVDGKGEPTPDPCGLCDACVAISEDRHMDVLEMDAASRTGVDDVREVIEAARYKAVSGRYKIYIIDEVHMLSKSAFNALLKTLEEPPPHVKFIFATTEIRKVPETVLSRCMRFDLKRVEPKILFDHFMSIMGKETLTIEEEALALIVRAADGSVRDGLSLLDQAIALSDGTITTTTVRDMLGLVDRGAVFALLRSLLHGQVAEALTQVRNLYQRGGDPVVLMEDLLDLVYWLTCLKTAPQLQQDVTWPESDRIQGAEIVKTLSLPALMRVWQVLHKGYEEVSRSPLSAQAAEMVLVRVAYLSDLPQADELLSALHGVPRARPAIAPTVEVVEKSSSPVTPPSVTPSSPEVQIHARAVTSPLAQDTATPTATPTPWRVGEVAPSESDGAGEGLEETQSLEESPILPPTFPALLELLQGAKEPILYSNILQDIHLVSYAPGSMTVRLSDMAAKTLPTQLRQVLERVTGQSWIVDVTTEGGDPTHAQQKKTAHEEAVKISQEHPLVQSLTSSFPGSTVTSK
ncbi:MAG: DNA polymerase III subunit gamma/tau [Alphaproteobacteria bacterium]|jgi:DNA polymerase-3 subunit gamma/tau|nr:DNA polymerase III subunit gamma/tau [Alphaproteobacteria bacterium]